MRDIFVVLADKEAQLKRLQSEIDLLRSAARLLTDGDEGASRDLAEHEKALSIVSEAPQREVRAAVGGIKQFP